MMVKAPDETEQPAVELSKAQLCASLRRAGQRRGETEHINARSASTLRGADQSEKDAAAQWHKTPKPRGRWQPGQPQPPPMNRKP